MNISKHFTLEELTTTNHNVENIPNETQIDNLTYLCNNLLEPIRENFNEPVIISSAFRCEALDNLVSAKPIPTSQHRTGQAVDIVGKHNLYEMYEYVKMNLDYDQMILEGCKSFDDMKSLHWLHISLKKEHNRREILVMSGGKYKKIK